MFKETDVFEITDYTTASDLERFVSDFEDILRQWKLTTKRVKSSESLPIESDNNRCVVVNFAKVSFNVTYHNFTTRCGEERNEDQALQEMMASDNDFPPDCHCICRYYGFQEFIVVSPVDSKDTIYTEDQTKLLLSAVSIALNDTNCPVPVLAQLFPRPRKFFQGIIVGSNCRTALDMVHFTQMSPNFTYLPELINLFKAKLCSPLASCPSVSVTTRLIYAVRNWPAEWLDAEDSCPSEEDDLTELTKLKFNMQKEPIEEFLLSTTWPSMSEELISDSPYYTDLNPNQAPIWTCRATFKDDTSSGPSDALLSFVNMKNAWSENDVILGRVIETIDEKDTEMEVKQALDKLVTPLPSLSLPQFKTKLKLKSHSTIRHYINYLFSKTDSTQEADEIFLDFRAYKSAPYNGFVWRLALLLCHIYHAYKDLSPIAYLWKDFVNELRRYWENREMIPGFENASAPNLATCLIHQKLELLSCCIHESRKHDQRNKQVDVCVKEDPSTDDEDEFYDAVEEPETMVRDGRLTKHEKLQLLKTGEPLYIPITQEPAPMTEDMLQEQALILSQLGTSAEGSLLRAKMQCANLISDMEAFKAANPGAILEDFIRWHSPRDYIEDENSETGLKQGHLSARMQQSGNIWREIWDSAEPVMASKQKRLFDYTKEAEKILHYFSSFTLTDLVERSMPVLIQCAIGQLVLAQKALDVTEIELSFDTVSVSRNACSGNFDYAVQFIRKLESTILKASSLKRKLELAHDAESSQTTKLFSWERVKRFVLDLVENKEVKIKGPDFDYLSAVIKRLIIEANVLIYKEKTTVGERDPQELMERSESLPPPVAREFILRVTTQRPALYSRALPQRMYCLISPSEFRLASAVSEDTVYF